MIEDGDIENGEQAPLLEEPQRVTSSSKSKTLYICLVSTCFVLLMASLAFVYYDLQQTISQQGMEITTLKKQFAVYKAQTTHSIETLQYDQSCIESNMRVMQKDINHNFGQYDERIFALENMTSNAEVLDELHWTERSLEKDMVETRKNVAKDLSKMQKNVTRQLAQSKSYVKEKLHDVDESIAASQERVAKLVEATYANVSSAVTTANQHVHSMERNVSGAMASMTETVYTAMQSVSDLVERAKYDIYAEVEEVHDSMDQYILFTNHQFAAENNFVKYQLAGEWVVP